MSEQRKKLKTWQGWAIFGGAMVFVFCLGLLAASITNRRAEITTIYANKKDKIARGEAKNPMYQGNYPREYETWTTDSRHEFPKRIQRQPSRRCIGATSQYGDFLGRIRLFARLYLTSRTYACHRRRYPYSAYR